MSKISLSSFSLSVSVSLIERARGVSLRQTRLIKPDDLELDSQLDDLEVDKLRLSRLIEQV